jgi:hypothetical protein
MAASRGRPAEIVAVREHARGADSLQLAAALIAADPDLGSLEFVCLDEQLTLAARRAGCSVLGA